MLYRIRSGRKMPALRLPVKLKATFLHLFPKSITCSQSSSRSSFWCVQLTFFLIPQSNKKIEDANCYLVVEFLNLISNSPSAFQMGKKEVSLESLLPASWKWTLIAVFYPVIQNRFLWKWIRACNLCFVWTRCGCPLAVMAEKGES